MHSTVLVKSVGVDTLTASAGEEGQLQELRRLGADLLVESAARGNRTHYFKRGPFVGVQTRDVGLADWRGRGLVELRGARAREHWADILPLSDKVSRIDVQVTVEEEPYNDARAVLAWFRSSRRAKREGRPPEYTLWADAAKGSTLYIGRLGSRFLARMYEKGKEEPDGPWENCWRYEVQARRERAEQMADLVKRVGDVQQSIPPLVHSHFASRGVEPIFDPQAAYELPPLPEEPPDTDRSLKWLGSSVAPVIQRLYDAGVYDQALARLGIGRTLENP